MLCGQKALCSLISLAGLTSLATLGEATVLMAGGEEKKKREKQKQPATTRKAPECSGVICSEPGDRLEQNLEKAKGSGYVKVES